MIKFLRGLFKPGPPHLHPCDLCFVVIKANGIGLCEQCQDDVVYMSKEEFHKKPRFIGMGKIG